MTASVEDMVGATSGRSSGQDMAWTWRRLLRWTAVASIAVSAFAIVTIGGEEAIVFAVLVALGLVWLRRPGRGAVIYLGVVQLLLGLVVLFLFELLPEMAYPASWKVFLTAGGRVVTTAVAVIAAVGAFRRGSPGGRAPRALAAVGGAALLAVIVVGVGARLTVTDDRRQPGDLELTITSESLFEPREVSAREGRISIYVTNDDVHHGNLTIDGVVSLDIPAGSAQRATFDLEAGDYRFYSTLFPEDLSGTIVVS